MSLIQKKFTLGDVGFDCWIFQTADNKFWFKGKDIAQFLGYVNTRSAIIDNVLTDWRTEWRNLKVVTLGDYLQTPHNWQPNSVFISEPGLYALITRSEKSEAVRVNVFEDWRRIWDDLKVSYNIAYFQIPHYWQPNSVFISEPGLYALITRSEKSEAVRVNVFEDWRVEWNDLKVGRLAPPPPNPT